jgi:AcrR family transcriptional regulator
MPKPRFYALPIARQRALLAAAAREFAEHGYGAASYNRVLRAAAVSKGAAYYYFEDKADLFATVVEDGWRRIRELAGPIDPARLTAATFWRSLRGLYRRQFQIFGDDPALRGVARALRALPDEPRLAARFAPIVEYQRALFARGRALGVVRRDLPLALVVGLVAAIDRAGDDWLYASWERLSRAERARLVDELFDAVRRLASPSHESG